MKEFFLLGLLLLCILLGYVLGSDSCALSEAETCNKCLNSLNKVFAGVRE